MPLTANEQALLGNPSSELINPRHQRLERSPPQNAKIGKWTLVALILNRTIGSGIFLTPRKILEATGCVGGALFLWVLGALISLCGLYVWLECGMSMPQRIVAGETAPRGVPRSGGEKNFLEFMFPSSSSRLPHIRTTCAFSIMFLLMYNLSGNAISFGIQVLSASGAYDPFGKAPPSQGAVTGIAIGALSFVIILHMFSRRGGILLNNIFAVLKVALLLAIICLGVAKAAGGFAGPGPAPLDNFTRDVFVADRTDPTSWSNALMLTMYAFSGFEQPFYVLAESKSPRQYFPRYTVLALFLAAVLFIMVNIAYLLAVPKDNILTATARSSNVDMATMFFEQLFEDQTHARRAMSALIAISIFGNLVVMTFTAARVKQEIAKEGILPKSLFFATSFTTPYGLWKKWMSRNAIAPEDLEQAPTAAFLLHWFTSILLILVTLPIRDPRLSYLALVSLYSYTIIALLGCWVSIGLLRIKFHRSRWYWQERRRYRPWMSPVHTIIYGLACSFMVVASFVKPADGSPFDADATGYPWYIIPTIGITAPLWGLVWYLGIIFYQWQKNRELIVYRTPFWMRDPDFPEEYVQRAEIVDHTWQIRPRQPFDFAIDQSDEERGDKIMPKRETGFLEDSGGHANSWPIGQTRQVRAGHVTMSDGLTLSTGFNS